MTLLQMNNYNEKEIIALLQDPTRQREAFEAIVKEYSEQLYWQIRRLVLSHEDANDILQNSFLKAWSNIDYFRGDAKMSTWLYRICLNECLTFINKQKANKQFSIDDADKEMLNKLESEAQGGLSVAGRCRCLTKDSNTSIEKEGYIPYSLQA